MNRLATTTTTTTMSNSSISSGSSIHPEPFTQLLDSCLYSSYSSCYSQQVKSTLSPVTTTAAPQLGWRAKNALLKTRSSIKSKLVKSRIFSAAAATSKPHETTPFAYKESTRKKIGAVQKLMEKSLGWLRMRNKKRKEATSKRATATAASSTTKNGSPGRVSCGEFYESQVAFDASQPDYCCLITAPSMCSSFDVSNAPLCLHSTPCSISQQFSPINSAFQATSSRRSASVSSSSSASMGSSPSTSSTVCSEEHRREGWRRRRLSFGATSSPVSVGEYQEASVISASQLRYLEHIKENIKLEVEMRNLQSEVAAVAAAENRGAGGKLGLGKKKKLQHIFRLKLRKQLKEIKRWQVGIRNELRGVQVVDSSQVRRDEFSRLMVVGQTQLRLRADEYDAPDCNCTACEQGRLF